MNGQSTILRRDDDAVAGDQRPSLHGLRVLFLPKNSRTPYFSGLLDGGRRTLDWETHVVGPQAHAKVWTGIVGERGGYFRVPDFNQRQAFEQDAAASSDLDIFIGECEKAAGISAGRIMLAGEREIGRGYSEPIYYWFKTPMSRKVLADNSEPTRIVRRMFAFARDTLQTAQPNLILAGEWADPLWFTFYLAARRLGIPCIVNRRSKLWSGRLFWSAGPLMYNDAARQTAERKRAENAPVSDRARQRIADFRDRPGTLGYVKQKWDFLDSRGFFGMHLDLARMWFANLRHRIGGHDRTAAKPVFQLTLEYYRRLFLNRRQAGFFRRFDEPALREMKYIYIALHKDPEQALNHQAPFWTNQLNTIALLSTALPNGYRLLAREQRNNSGRRPTAWYRNAARLPGVVLIDGFDDQFKYIRNADLVVTDNGSTGWESLLLGRPTITLADTYYDGAGIARRVGNPADLGRAILDLLQQGPVRNWERHDHALACMLDAEWEHSTPLDEKKPEDAFRLLGALAGMPPSPLTSK